MDTSIHGSGTDFGASITPFVLSFSPQLHGRYKNRLQLGPEARCIGVDMNRYAVLNLCLDILTNLMIGIGWDFSFTTQPFR